MSAYKHSERAGFTLLEVVVATTILALGISVSLRIFSEGLNSVSRIDLAHKAMNHAENIMNEILSDESVVGPTNLGGDLDEEFSYTAAVDFWQEAQGELVLAPVEPRVQLLSVQVDVHFKNDIRGKLYRAISLKTVPTEAASTSPLNSTNAIRRLFGARE
jgi:prepilin-type N-terminal cleavage/methylation domain-containing protein